MFDFSYHNERGVVLARAGRPADAIPHFEAAAALSPDDLAPLGNLGLAYQQSERIDDAIATYRKYVTAYPNAHEIHRRLAAIFHSLGQWPDAASHFRRVADIVPDNVEARHALATCLVRAERLDDAVPAYMETLRLRPDWPEVLNNFGIVLQDLGRHSEAAVQFRRSLELAPDTPETHSNLGISLAAEGKWEEAEACHRRAIALKPDMSAAHNNLGNVLRNRDRLDEAEASLRKAVELKPDYAEAYSNLGIVHVQQDRVHDALASYGKAVELKSDYADARMNRSFAMLQTGDFAVGWTEYEWRWKRPGAGLRQYAAPAWDGSDPTGKVVYLWPEQGQGDTIQFARYASVVKAMGAAKVVLEAPAPLAKLLGTIPWLDEIVVQGQSTPTFDCHAPLMSLPRLCGTDLESIPAGVPYLRPDPARAKYWRARLSGEEGLKVGIVWQGNPKYPGDRHRSVRLEQVRAALGNVLGVSWFSLQRGAGHDQLGPAAAAGWDVVDLGGPDAGDWAETAAQVAALDVVIAVDTAVAHLAGALGVGCWVLLPVASDWRWLRDRSDSPWYPSARLFRQTTRGDWSETLKRVGTALTSLTRRGKPTSGRSTGFPSAEVAEGLHQRGVARVRANRASDAIAVLERAAELAGTADVWHNLGVARAKAGRLRDAVSAFEKALATAPESVGALGNLGLALVQLKDWPAAEGVLRRATAADPKVPDNWNHLGVALAAQDRHEDAVAAYREATGANANAANSWNNLGNALRNGGKLADAEAAFREAVRLAPNLLESVVALGGVLQQAGRPSEAVPHFRRAVELRPEDVEARAGLASALSASGTLDEAADTYRRALEQSPGSSEIYNNLAIVHLQLGQTAEALACYDEAVRLNPKNAEARFNRGMGLLREGRFAEGWTEYEWRWSRPGQGPREYPVPRWDGSDITGKTIFLWPEQGQGDTIQFARYAGAVKTLGAAKVVLEASAPLATLLATTPGVDEVVTPGRPLPPFDCHSPLMSLPHGCRTDHDTIPTSIPYLTPVSERVESWRARLSGDSGLRVGLVWQGNPSYAADRHRSVKLADLLRAFGDVSGVAWFSLQRGAGHDQLGPAASAGWDVIDLGGPDPGDWAETAAQVAALDLVIAVDTAVAHLAGALGVPTWVLIPFASDWRWLRDRSDTPWYPTVRLFRQPARGDWASVLNELRHSLGGLASQTPPRAGEYPANLVADGLHQRGVARVRANRMADAIGVLERAAELAGTADVWHNLGVARAKAGRLRDAVNAFHRALAFAPDSAGALGNLGLALVQLKDWVAAEAVLRRATNAAPDIADNWNHLGVALAAQNRRDEAIEAYRAVVSARPSHARAWNNLGNALRSAGRLEEAKEAFEGAVAADPGLSEASDHLAAILETLGRLAESARVHLEIANRQPGETSGLIRAGNLFAKFGDAESAVTAFRRAIEISPRLAEAHNSLGLVYKDLGRYEEAVACYARTAELVPDQTAPHINAAIAYSLWGKYDAALEALVPARSLAAELADIPNCAGNILRKMSRFSDASAEYRRAIKLKPDFLPAYTNLALVLREGGDAPAAESVLQTAIALKPESPDAVGALAAAVADAGRPADAIPYYRRALELNPSAAEVWSNYGIALWKDEQLDAAIEAYRTAIRLRPQFADAHNNLAIVLVQQDRVDDALASYATAVELKPDYADAHLNRSFAMLQRGEYAEGWTEYEWRWKRPGFGARTYPAPLWDGSNPTGKVVYLWPEQGQGDTIQFARYATVVKSLGATKVILEAPAPLAGLLGTIPGVDELVVQGQGQTPAFDLHSPLMSLPKCCGTTPFVVPDRTPYLFPPADRVSFWRSEVASTEGLRVGLVWQGNPKYPGDRHRSVRLDRLREAIADVPRVKWFGLQRGAGHEQLEPAIAAGWDLVDLGGPEPGDWAETAARIASLDVVIAVDTAVAHLAGALGVSTWVLLPLASDWRWLRSRSDSPWYPTARLFRQTRRGDWTEPLQGVRDALAEGLGRRTVPSNRERRRQLVT